MRRLLCTGLMIIAWCLAGPLPAEAACTPVAQSEQSFFDTLLHGVVIPVLQDVAAAWLPHLMGAVLPPGATPVATPAVNVASACQTTAPAAAADPSPPKAGLAYTMFKVSNHQVALATDSTTYKTGEGAGLIVVNNVPGVLDVWNIDGAKRLTKIDSIKLTDIGSFILPHSVKGYYQLDASPGDETLLLAFFPCQGGSEALTAVSDDTVYAALSDKLKPSVAASLPVCPTAAQRQAAFKPQDESLVPVADGSVAIALAEIANLKPIVVSITLHRS